MKLLLVVMFIAFSGAAKADNFCNDWNALTPDEQIQSVSNADDDVAHIVSDDAAFRACLDADDERFVSKLDVLCATNADRDRVLSAVREHAAHCLEE